MAMETQDIIKRSATNSITPPSQVRDYKAEVAKLIDVSTCIGCKACQVACSEWNDIRDEVGHCVGVYDNPADLSAKSCQWIFETLLSKRTSIEFALLA
nr:formate dehydrogenase O beta subunit [uncultured bacterium]